jgi:hypothetical protein
MGLSNSAKRASSYTQTINQNQGGGSKKAGFPYMVGRGWRSSIAFNNTNVVGKSCCKLENYQRLLYTFPVSQSRGIGVDVRLPTR